MARQLLLLRCTAGQRACQPSRGAQRCLLQHTPAVSSRHAPAAALRAATLRPAAAAGRAAPISTQRASTLLARRRPPLYSSSGGRRRARRGHALLAVVAAASVLGGPVLGAAVGAAFKLLLLCALVGGLVRVGTLPPETPRVLSEVSYWVVTPAMLLTRVGETVAGATDPWMVAVPLAAALQVLLGTLLGRWAARLATEGGSGGGGGARGPGAAAAAALVGGGGQVGWHPRNPAKSAAAIARTTAAASGVPRAAVALKSAPRREDDGGSAELVTVMCGFCNSLTLPLVLVASLLPAGAGGATAAAADSVLAYTALIQVAWFPLLWSVGYRTLTRQHAKVGTGWRTRGSLGARGDAAAAARIALINRVGARPPEGQPGGKAAAARGEAGRRLSRAAIRAQHYVGKMINPPLLGVFAGVLLGLSQLGRTLLLGPGGGASVAAAGGGAAAMAMPPEIRLITSVASCAVEVIAILGSGAMAVQSIVLGSSLFAPLPGAKGDGISDTSDSMDDEPGIQRLPSSGISGGAGGGSTSSSSSSSRGATSPARPATPLLPPVTLAASPTAAALEDVQSPAALERLLGRMSSASSSSSLPSPEASGSVPGAGGGGGGGADSAAAGGDGAGTSSGGNDGGSRRNPSSRPVRPPPKPTRSQALLAAWRALPLSRWLRALLPASAVETRMLLAVAGVRFVAMPAIGAAMVLALRAARLLPPDPLCSFALLLQCVMPPAQSLTVMVQLQPATRRLAPVTARLMLRLYACAVVPVTLWVTLFAAWLRVPLPGVAL